MSVSVYKPNHFPYGRMGPYNPTPFAQRRIYRPGFMYYPAQTMYGRPYITVPSYWGCANAFLGNRNVPPVCCASWGVGCVNPPDRGFAYY